LDYSRVEKFEWPKELISELVRLIEEPSFSGIDLDLPDLNLLCSQRGMIHLRDLCEFYEDLVIRLGLKENSKWHSFLQMPLWKADASGFSSDFEMVHIKGEPFLRRKKNLYDPKLIIAKEYADNTRVSSVTYFHSKTTSILEIVGVEAEEFSPPQKEPLQTFTSSYLLFESSPKSFVSSI
jgi:hypothetical protein